MIDAFIWGLFVILAWATWFSRRLIAKVHHSPSNKISINRKYWN